MPRSIFNIKAFDEDNDARYFYYKCNYPVTKNKNINYFVFILLKFYENKIFLFFTITAIRYYYNYFS